MRLPIAGLFVVLALPTSATELPLNLTDQDQQNVVAMPGILDQCIAGMTLRNDPSACKIVAQVLNAMSQAVTKGQQDAKAKGANATPGQ